MVQQRKVHQTFLFGNVSVMKAVQNSEDAILMVTLRTDFNVFYDFFIFSLNISWSISFSNHNPVYFEFCQLLVTTRASLSLGVDIFC